MAPPIAEAVAAARRDGVLQVSSGRLLGMEPGDRGVEVRWRARDGSEQQLLAQRVIDCRGPGTDYARLPHPLIRQLLGQGLVRPDPNRLGLETTPHGALVAEDGAPSPTLFAIGPVTRGTFWEIISVPDIREQAEQVAVNVLEAARLAGRRAA
jgi:uncharacterized NAD(P)/FAD-binding protein YdhS